MGDTIGLRNQRSDVRLVSGALKPPPVLRFRPLVYRTTDRAPKTAISGTKRSGGVV